MKVVSNIGGYQIFIIDTKESHIWAYLEATDV
jgi:hypothetical protein